jgi:hypothetical protein
MIIPFFTSCKQQRANSNQKKFVSKSHSKSGLY